MEKQYKVVWQKIRYGKVVEEEIGMYDRKLFAWFVMVFVYLVWMQSLDAVFLLKRPEKNHEDSSHSASG